MSAVLHGGEFFGRVHTLVQTTDILLCERARLQLKAHNTTSSLPTLLTLITWADTTKNTGTENVFQCVIATNEKESNLMFIYATLTESEGTVGIMYETCGNMMFSVSNMSARTLEHTTKQYSLHKQHCSKELRAVVYITATSSSLPVLTNILILLGLLIAITVLSKKVCGSEVDSDNQDTDIHNVRVTRSMSVPVQEHKKLNALLGRRKSI